MINDQEIIEKINQLKESKFRIKLLINKIKSDMILDNTPFKKYADILRTLITNTVVENDYREYPTTIFDKIQFFKESSNKLKYLLQLVGVSAQINTLDDIVEQIPVAYEIYLLSLPKQYIYGYLGSRKCILNVKTNLIEYVDYFEQDPCRTFKYCVIDDCATRHINYYLDMTDMTKKADGTDACLTGEDGDVFVELPAFHFRCLTLSDGTKRKLMSTLPFEGSIAHPFSLVSPDGKTARTQYVGYYIATVEGALPNTHTCIEFPWYGDGFLHDYGSYVKLRSINGGSNGNSHTRTWFRLAARHNGANLINTMFYAYLHDITLAEAEFPCAYLSPILSWVIGSPFFDSLTGFGNESSDPIYIMLEGIQIYKDTPYKYTLSTDAYSDAAIAALSDAWLTHNIVMIGNSYSNAWGNYINDGDLNLSFDYQTLDSGYKYKYASASDDVGYLGKPTFEGLMTSEYGATDFPHIVIRGKDSLINYALHYILSLGYLWTRIQC